MSKRGVKVPCRVTGRWLELSQRETHVDGGPFVTVRVMTKDHKRRNRQLCTVLLSPDILADMARQFPSRA